MNQNKFSKLENNYYYGISRVFWHIIIGLGSLAIIGGIAILVWSQIPPSKDKVVKENTPTKKSYPKPTGVSLSELMSTLPKGEELTKVKNAITKVSNQTNIPTGNNDIPELKIDTIGLSKLNKQIDVLKTLVPYSENKTLWEGQGHYVFKGETRDKRMRNERMFKRTRSEGLRSWVFSSKSIDIEFIEITDKQSLKSYTDKTILLTSYNNLLKNINKEKRASLLKNNLLDFYKNKKGLSKSVAVIESISKIIKLIDSEEQITAFKVLENFSRHNPNDGLGLQKFQESILQNFEINQRLNIINTINNEYTKNYDFQLGAIIDNTKQFIPMLPSLKGDQQPVALKNFYKLFKSKNRNRDQQIQQIDNEFNALLIDNENQYLHDLAEAEANFVLKEGKKKTMKALSYESMAYGLGVVLLISLILLVLSMIRNVNRLAEAMLKNQNK